MCRVQHEFFEQRPHFRRFAVHAFGVPLYADGEGVRGHFQCLDGVVRGARADGEALAGRVDGLVVVAVDEQVAADVGSQLAVRRHADAVADLAAGIGLLHVVQVPAGLQGDVLVNRAAAGDVVDLHAAADGEDGFFCFQDLPHQANLEQVQRDVGLPVPVFRFLSEKQGGDVVPAAEEEAVAKGNVLRQHVVGTDEGQDERNAAGITHGLDVSVGDELPVV